MPNIEVLDRFVLKGEESLGQVQVRTAGEALGVSRAERWFRVSGSIEVKGDPVPSSLPN